MFRIWEWVNERWPVKKLMYWSMDEPIIGGASFAYALGSATLLAFVIQVISGIWQLFYYVPTVDHAYNSLNYMRTQVPFGWLMHGLHYWGASLMIILAAMHLTRVFIFGAYKPPRELVWLTGVGLLLLTMGLSFTGAPLPWDERGYWAAEVGTSIAGTVPIIGDFSKRLLRGGETMGQLALSRMFIIHVAILPGLLMALIGAHLMAFRQFGSIGPWNAQKRKKWGAFWPDQVLKDLIVSGTIILVLIGLSAFFPPPFAGPADPADSSYIPMPEWNFLFLYEALKFFPGSLEVLGTVGLPGLGLGLMVLLPFLDRNPERDPRKRPIAMGAFALIAAAIIGLTIIGLKPPPSQSVTAPQAPAGSVAKLSKTALQGQALFKSVGCIGCHTINGNGGKVGPDLSLESQRGRSRQWLIQQLRNSKVNEPNSFMPPFTTLTDAQVNSLLDYVLSASSSGPGDETAAAVPGATPGAPGAATPTDTPTPADSGTPTPADTATPADSTPTPAETATPGTPTPADTATPGTPTPADTSTPGAAATPVPNVSPNATMGSGAQAAGQPPVEPAGPPGLAATMMGAPDLGKDLFAKDCASCHGPDGTGGVVNPGSADGTVPTLNPISLDLFDRDADVFADNIDRFIQHGSMPPGPGPALHMPAFGATKALTQQEIANVEAYIMQLNTVNRGAIEHPGVDPRTFFYLVLVSFVIIGGALFIIGLALRPTKLPEPPPET